MEQLEAGSMAREREEACCPWGEIGFWGGGVNEETAESAEGAEGEVECEFP